MKKVALLAFATAGLGIGAVQAVAADLPVKARPMVPVAAPMTWTGCYVGGHLGYGWSKWHDRSLPNAVRPEVDVGLPGGGGPGDPLVFGYSGSYSTDGFVGGGQFGCDKQFGQFVLGAVIDISWTDQKDSITGFQIQPSENSTSSGVETASVKMKYFGTARARAGYLFTPDWLFYGTGGLAWARASMSVSGEVAIVNNLFPFAVSNDTNFVGWSAGAGFDWRFMPNWTLGVEYLHLDLGDANFKFGSTFPNATSTFVLGQGVNMKLRSDLVRATINYRF